MYFRGETQHGNAGQLWPGSVLTGFFLPAAMICLGLSLPFSCISLLFNKGKSLNGFTCALLRFLFVKLFTWRNSHIRKMIALFCVTVHSFIPLAIHSFTHSTACTYPHRSCTKLCQSAELPSRDPQTEQLQEQKLIFSLSSALEIQEQLLVGWVPPEALSLACTQPSSPCVSIWPSLCVCLSTNFLFLHGHQALGLGPPHNLILP